MTSSCQLFFALQREAEPLLRRFGLDSLWEPESRRFQIRLPTSAKLASGDIFVSVTGMGLSSAQKEAERVLSIAPGISLAISVGICGGLSPAWNVGDVCIPEEVVDEEGCRWPCVSLGFLQKGRLLSVKSLIATPHEKHALHRQYDADVVDMEAAAIAQVCAERKIAFAAIKAVSDAADAALPRELGQFAPQGIVHGRQLILSLLRRPSLIIELIRLGRNSAKASKKACEQVRQALAVS